MKILGISGTPRKGGNSEILLNAAIEPISMLCVPGRNIISYTKDYSII